MDVEQRDQALREAARQALDAVEAALRLPPAECKEEVDVAERGIVHLRDRLIQMWRQRQSDDEGTRIRWLLDQANACLSLVVGIEYPASGIRRKALEAARQALLVLQQDIQAG